MYQRFVLFFLAFTFIAVAPLLVSKSAKASCDYSNAASQNGWGWDSVVQSSCPPLNQLPSEAAPERPVCVNPGVSDPDGDGWGWENSRSCVVQAEDLSPMPQLPGLDLVGNTYDCRFDDVDPDNPNYWADEVFTRESDVVFRQYTFNSDGTLTVDILLRDDIDPVSQDSNWSYSGGVWSINGRTFDHIGIGSPDGRIYFYSFNIVSRLNCQRQS